MKQNSQTPEQTSPLTEKERAKKPRERSPEEGGATPEAAETFTPAALDDRMLASLHAASDKKAQDLVVLDLRAIASFTDYFLITSGTNVRQVQAISDEIVERLKKQGTRAARVEGYNAAEWILIDYGDFIVHIFEDKARRFYDLERLWREAGRVAVPPELTGGEGSLRKEQ
jgi:ribosome-associated protein